MLIVSPGNDNSGEAGQKNEKSIPEEDNEMILKNLDKDDTAQDLYDEEDPEEIMRRQEEMLEEFLEQVYAESQADPE